MDDILFREVQRFRQPWILALLLGIVAIFAWGFVQQIVLGVPWGNNPASDTLMWVLLLFIGALVVFILAIRLEVTVSAAGLSVRFFPLHLRSRHFGRSEIVEHRAMAYHPLRDFGGWGIRYGRTGWAYIVRGTEGVLVRTFDGRQLLIGSLRAVELDAAIGVMCKKAKRLEVVE